MQLSPKQKEFWRAPYHRWNIKHGATRTGKTYLDYFMIPRRIRERIGREGLVTLMGNTKGTLQRNVIEPMQEIYGAAVISSIRSDNTATIFGERVHCLGADNKKHVDRLRGTSIKYCYGDEVATWNQEVFQMLKSRLDKPYSTFDGTCNPEHQTHWFKEFIDSDNDIFAQNYELDDNPFLDPQVAADLKHEYRGTVYYDRYILGRWVRAEGAIYKIFADSPEKYLVDKPEYDFIQIGVDFGGNKSAFAFVATGLKHDYSTLTALCCERWPAKGLTPEDMYRLLEAFITRIRRDYGQVAMIYADSAEQTLINGIRGRIDVPVRDSVKNPIMDRVRAVVGLVGAGRFFYTKDCETLKDALCNAVYDEKKLEDVRLDDGTSDIDTLDAFEYSFERYLRGYAREAHLVGDGG